MTKTTTYPSSKFVWFEYVSTEAAKAQGFYGELFNWGTRDVPMPNGSYTMITAGGETIGGYMTTPPGAPARAHWMSHLAVADAHASAERVKALGGRVGKAPFKMGDAGTMAVVFDPLDGMFALWQSAQPAAAGTPVWKGTPGNWCWNELHTQDAAKSVAFYTQLAGFSDAAMEMPGMGAYHQLMADGVPRGGILKPRMPDAPQSWLPYVQVASADATHTKAKKLGATVHVPPTDIPGVGRFAVFADPCGASIGVLQPM
jgi:hypothetical protein